MAPKSLLCFRSFITTDVNPYYDSFVRWQFLKLQERKKIKFGKRYTVFSPKDNQPCMDHDRQTGEGVGPLEYTLIKIQLIDSVPSLNEGLRKRKLGNSKVFLVAATLRPETMYGQTNCWLHPDITYSAYLTKDGEVWISTARSARNMAYQEMFKDFSVDKICDVKGQELMGKAIKAPLTSYEKVFILPMMTIKEDKGTGVVTSVPSDSPDDYMALKDLKKKPAFREKFGLSDEAVLPFEPIPIIDIPGLGDLAAVTVSDQMKIQSQNDSDKLTDAKKEVYMKGFYEGVLKVGDFAGQSVQKAKKLVQQQMIDQNLAVKYMECESNVISRSNDVCVVALCDQWYLDYGEETWKQKVRDECLPNVNTFSQEVNNNFVQTLDWLQEHACCRTYGLGSRLPWDETWLIESLSDSTIYNAYYTVAHLLQGDLNGSVPGLLKIKPEEVTPDVWDYIFFNDAPKPKSSISDEKLSKLRHEFRYWYPVDMRASGKDLIPNHLTYYLYNHVAIWPKEPKMWPQSIHANGHLLINNEKMSKSTGNFMTLSESITKFSADGMRLALADAGDNIEDANFLEKVADTAILRIFTFVEWVREFVEDEGEVTRDGPDDELFCDRVFANEMDSLINQTKEHYVKMNYKDALRTAFFEFQACRDRYRELSLGKLHKGLTKRFIKNQVLILSPICPHICEHIWSFVGEKGSILNALWPETQQVDEVLIKSCQYLLDAAHDFRLWHQSQSNPKPPKGVKPQDMPKEKLTHGTIYVAEKFPEWQDSIISALKDLYIGNSNEFPANNIVADKIKKLNLSNKYAKKSMPFAQKVKADVQAQGVSVFEQSSQFSETEILSNNKDYLKQTLNLEEIEIVPAREAPSDKIRDECCPLKPMSNFYAAPHVLVEFINPQPCSGYFSVKVPVYQSDSLLKVKKRIMRASKIKSESSLSIYRYEDPIGGPLTIPVLEEPLKGKVKCEDSCEFRTDFEKKVVHVANAGSGDCFANNVLIYYVDLAV